MSDSGINSTDNFPLITLQPVADAGHFWVALMLEGDVPLDSSVLTRVLRDYALAAALDDAVSCIAVVDPRDRKSTRLNSSH